jgi:hypothetical protein
MCGRFFLFMLCRKYLLFVFWSRILSTLKSENKNMIIERTKDEVIIRIPSNIDTEDLQDFINYIRYKEITSKFKVSKKEVNDIVSDVKNDLRTKYSVKAKK